MGNLFSKNFWLSTLTSTIVTIMVLYILLKIANTVNIPVFSSAVKEVVQ